MKRIQSQTDHIIAQRNIIKTTDARPLISTHSHAHIYTYLYLISISNEEQQGALESLSFVGAFNPASVSTTTTTATTS